MEKLKLYITVGLPASGKTTWAKEMQTKDPTIVRVNKDDMRSMLHNSKWSKNNEKQVIITRNMIVGTSLSDGRSVIVDDTNLHPKHLESLSNIAKKNNAEVIVKDFTDIPLQTCIKRDSNRVNSVGKKNIMRMYNSFIKKESSPLKPVVYKKELPYCFIFDLDGTLAHINNRSPYDGKSCSSDKVNESIRALFQIIKDPNETLSALRWSSVNRKVIILSGRSDNSIEETKEWLNKHDLNYDELHMREEGDARKDSIVKKEMFDKYIKNKYNVVFIVDDRDQVVDLWRSMGITCLQCNYGDF